MLTEFWKSADWARITVNILGGLSVVVALYLLLIAYRKSIIYLGFGKRKKITVKYAKVYDLKPVYAKGKVQFGVELEEETEFEFNVLNEKDEIVENLHAGKKPEGLHAILFDTTRYPNDYYYFQYKSEVQNIVKKFVIDN